MNDRFLTFKKFNYVGLATEIGEELRAENIPYSIEDNKLFFDASFANNSFEPDVSLKLNPADFTRARLVLDKYYTEQINHVDPDYNLFDF
ncbi:MAG: hypothetical protein ABIX01_14290 [Chitinophagaceae bacterium]